MLKKEKNTISTEKTGNMLINMNKRVSNRDSKAEADLAALAVDLAASEYTYSSGDEGGFSDFFESLFGGGKRQAEARQNIAGRIITQNCRCLLSDAYSTHKQTITINGKNVRVTIPAGVENGQKLKLKGFGSPGANGGPNGDLFITFVIKNDTNLKREGNDLYKTEDWISIPLCLVEKKPLIR